MVDQQLRETDNYDQMQQIVEAFLLRRLRQKLVEKQPVDSALQLLMETARPVTVDSLAEQACLSALLLHFYYKSFLYCGLIGQYNSLQVLIVRAKGKNTDT
jgi:hypothetical protein